MNIQEFFKEKPVPKWMSSHPIFKEIEQVKKVFPAIGLNNCEEDYVIDNLALAQKSAKQLLADIAGQMSHRISKLQVFHKAHEDMSAIRKAKMDKCIWLLDTLANKIKEKAEFVAVMNGRVTINLPEDIVYAEEARPTFRNGEGLFRVYNKLTVLLKDAKFAQLSRLENYESFKQFSTNNVPNNRLKVVFSSHDVNGLWDIATMSMRGVQSCQSWGGEYRHCLIGSILDPFVGIIYITSGADFGKYGPKMIKRCIVRYVINEDSKKPYILIDNMYPGYDKQVMEAFKDFLKKHTKNKFEVHYAPDVSSEKFFTNSYMPLTKTRKLLSEYGGDREDNYDDDGYDDDGDPRETLQSYQDYHVKNKESQDKNSLYEKNAKIKAKRFIKNFSDAFAASIADIDVAEFPDAIKPAIRRLKGKGVASRNGRFVTDASGVIAKDIISSIDKNNYSNSDDYLTKLYYTYFLNKEKVLESIKTKFTRSLNGRLDLRGDHRLRGIHFTQLMKAVLPKIDEQLKVSMKSVIDSKKKTKTLPLP